jgi:hypothetical protein
MWHLMSRKHPVAGVKIVIFNPDGGGSQVMSSSELYSNTCSAGKGTLLDYPRSAMWYWSYVPTGDNGENFMDGVEVPMPSMIQMDTKTGKVTYPLDKNKAIEQFLEICENQINRHEPDTVKVIPQSVHDWTLAFMEGLRKITEEEKQ